MKHKHFKSELNKCITIWSGLNSNFQLNILQDYLNS